MVAIGAVWWIVAQIGWIDPADAEVAAPPAGARVIESQQPKSATEVHEPDAVGVVDAFYAWVRDYVNRTDASPGSNRPSSR